MRRVAQPPLSHEPTQARPILPMLWVLLENLTERGNVFVRAICLFAVMILLAVVRPRHLQRSVITVYGTLITAKVSKGKRRIRGQQAPFRWAAANRGITSTDLGAVMRLHLDLAHCATNEKPFLLPSFIPAPVEAFLCGGSLVCLSSSVLVGIRLLACACSIPAGVSSCLCCYRAWLASRNARTFIGCDECKK